MEQSPSQNFDRNGTAALLYQNDEAEVSDDEDYEAGDDEEDVDIPSADEDDTLGGFVTHSPDEDADETMEDRPRRKRPRDEKKRRKNDKLTRDDLDLIEENTGRRVSKSTLDDDVDSSDESDDDHKSRKRLKKKRKSQSISSDEESGDDQKMDEEPPPEEWTFVVDDGFERSNDPDGYQLATSKFEHTNEAMRTATQIFGPDFRDFLEAGGIYVEQGKRQTKVSASSNSGDGSVFQTFEPEQLKKMRISERDDHIRTVDVPERMVERFEDFSHADLDSFIIEEAGFIAKQAPFIERDIAIQECISDVLKLLLIKRREIPFIATYNREYWAADPAKIGEEEIKLKEEDLWTIYDWDKKYMHYRNRLANCKKIVENAEEDTNKSIHTYLEIAENEADLEDCQVFISTVTDNKQSRADPINDEDEEKEEGEKEKERGFKRPEKRAVFRNETHGLGGFMEVLGSALKLGENIRSTYQKNPVQDPDKSPNDFAVDLFSERYPTSDDVIENAIRLAARDVAKNPYVRQCVRKEYVPDGNEVPNAIVYTVPTRKGKQEIDWNHEFLPVKRLSKPMTAYGDGTMQFVMIDAAKQLGFITCSIELIPPTANDTSTTMLVNKLEDFYLNGNNGVWDKLRYRVLTEAVDKYLRPMGEKRLYDFQLNRARENVAKKCGENLSKMLNVKPAQVGQRIMSCAIGDYTSPTTVVVLNSHGELVEHISLSFIKNRVIRKESFKHMKNKNADFIATQKTVSHQKNEDLEKFKRFVKTHQPSHVIIGAESLACRQLEHDIEKAVAVCNEHPSVWFLDPEVAHIFQESQRGHKEFPLHKRGLKNAVSLGRRILNPMAELTALWTPDTSERNDVLSLNLDDLMKYLPADLILRTIQRSYMGAVMRHGVDINEMINRPHLVAPLQFVSGLGPLKAKRLLDKIAGSHYGYLLNRRQLRKILGFIVLENAAGFIKLSPQLPLNIQDTDSEKPPFYDTTRIHPTHYTLANQVVVDALELTYNDDESNELVNSMDMDNEMKVKEMEDLIGALRMPQKLKELDKLCLDVFAAELEKSDPERKVKFNLIMIREELANPYKDERKDFENPTGQQLFYLLSGESWRSLHHELLITVTVSFISKLFVKCRLDSGLSGTIDWSDLTDDAVNARFNEPEEFMKKIVMKGMSLQARVKDINYDNFDIFLDSKERSVNQKQLGRPPLPDCSEGWLDLDHKDDSEDVPVKRRATKAFLKRNIDFPLFKNIDKEEAEKYLEDKDIGDVVIRPSTRGSDHLTITWKISADKPYVYVHIDVKEEDKPNKIQIGERLFINKEEFEDLDQVVAVYIKKLTNNVRLLIKATHFRFGTAEEVDNLIKDEKTDNPQTIPIAIRFSFLHPGYFVLGYVFNTRVMQEYIKVTTKGFKFRKREFKNPNQLIDWFKRHPTDDSPFKQEQFRHPNRSGYNNHSHSRRENSSSHRNYDNPAATPEYDQYGSSSSRRTPDYGSSTPQYGANKSGANKSGSSRNRTPDHRSSYGEGTPQYGSPNRRRSRHNDNYRSRDHHNNRSSRDSRNRSSRDDRDSYDRRSSRRSSGRSSRY